MSLCNFFSYSMFQSTLESTANTQTHDNTVYNFLDKIKTISISISIIY